MELVLFANWYIYAQYSEVRTTFIHSTPTIERTYPSILPMQPSTQLKPTERKARELNNLSYDQLNFYSNINATAWLLLFPFFGHVFTSQGIGTLQESAMARCTRGRPGASVQQRDRPGGHSAAQIERSARCLLHRHLRSGRRNEPQEATGKVV